MDSLRSPQVFSEWQVNFKDGKGWQPVGEATMRKRLSGVYRNVNTIMALMSEQPGKFEADNGYASYRRNPHYGLGN